MLLSEKTDGTQKLILNLISLNMHLEYKYLKMQTPQPNCYMSTLGLKDAYYSAKTNVDDTRFLKLLCNTKLSNFVFSPNGLPPDTSKFAKVKKLH